MRIISTPAFHDDEVGDVGVVQDRMVALYGDYEVNDYLVNGGWRAEFALEGAANE